MMRCTLVTLLVVATLVASAFAGPTVNIDSGAVEGVVDTQLPSVNVFRGIPFAASTAGPNRWRPPQPVASWPGVYDASKFGNMCPQSNAHATWGLERSEDCLFINVWAPANPRGLNPVLVWIHGGGFIDGSGAHKMFTGSKLTNQSDIVVVTFNYRMGALGFLAARTPQGETLFDGNYGFQDQQAALQWVQRNIRQFGGDPSRVTLAGQSAGAMSVQFHLVSPASKPLFAQAWLMSPAANLHYRNLDQNFKAAEVFAHNVWCKGVADVECLRNAKWESIVAVEIVQQIIFTWETPLRTLTVFPWSPTIDGTLIPKSPYEAAQSGTLHPVPLVVGSTKNESYGFIPEAINVDAGFYQLFLDVTFKPNVSDVTAFYPTIWPAASMYSALTDLVFGCPVRSAASEVSKYNPNVWLYQFMHSPSKDPTNSKRACSGQEACHSCDIPFIFQSQSYLGYTWTPAEQLLSAEYSGSFITFIKGGAPWERYTSKHRVSKRFDIGRSEEVMDYRERFCNFWDDTGYPY